MGGNKEAGFLLLLSVYKGCCAISAQMNPKSSMLLRTFISNALAGGVKWDKFKSHVSSH